MGELIALCEDIPALWDAPTTTNANRKELIRIMIDKVRLESRDQEKLRALIHWADNHPATLVEVERRHSGHVKKLITDMLDDGMDTEQIAQRLNELEILTTKGCQWLPATVRGKIRYMRAKGELPSGNDQAA